MLSADAVIAWNQVLLDAIRVDRTPPPLAARNMAIVQISVFEAVNSIDRSYEPYFRRIQIARSASAEAAADAAAYRALANLYPAQAATFDAVLQSTLAVIPNGPSEEKGIAAGYMAADQTLALRSNDGANAAVPYTPR